MPVKEKLSKFLEEQTERRSKDGARSERQKDAGMDSPRKEPEFRKKEVVDRLSGKINKEEANYRDADERSSKEMCAECEHYLTPGELYSSCRRVAGIVEGGDTCDLFAARPTEGGE